MKRRNFELPTEKSSSTKQSFMHPTDYLSDCSTMKTYLILLLSCQSLASAQLQNAPQIDLLDVLGLKNAAPINGDKLVQNLGKAFLGAIFPESDIGTLANAPRPNTESPLTQFQPDIDRLDRSRGPPTPQRRSPASFQPRQATFQNSPQFPPLANSDFQQELFRSGLTGRTDLPASYVYPFARPGAVLAADRGTQNFALGPEGIQYFNDLQQEVLGQQQQSPDQYLIQPDQQYFPPTAQQQYELNRLATQKRQLQQQYLNLQQQYRPDAAQNSRVPPELTSFPTDGGVIDFQAQQDRINRLIDPRVQFPSFPQEPPVPDTSGATAAQNSEKYIQSLILAELNQTPPQQTRQSGTLPPIPVNVPSDPFDPSNILAASQSIDNLPLPPFTKQVSPPQIPRALPLPPVPENQHLPDIPTTTSQPLPLPPFNEQVMPPQIPRALPLPPVPESHPFPDIPTTTPLPLPLPDIPESFRQAAPGSPFLISDKPVVETLAVLDIQEEVYQSKPQLIQPSKLLPREVQKATATDLLLPPPFSFNELIIPPEFRSTVPTTTTTTPVPKTESRVLFATNTVPLLPRDRPTPVSSFVDNISPAFGSASLEPRESYAIRDGISQFENGRTAVLPPRPRNVDGVVDKMAALNVLLGDSSKHNPTSVFIPLLPRHSATTNGLTSKTPELAPREIHTTLAPPTTTSQVFELDPRPTSQEPVFQAPSTPVFDFESAAVLSTSIDEKMEPKISQIQTEKVVIEKNLNFLTNNALANAEVLPEVHIDDEAHLRKTPCGDCIPVDLNQISGAWTQIYGNPDSMRTIYTTLVSLANLRLNESTVTVGDVQPTQPSCVGLQIAPLSANQANVGLHFRDDSQNRGLSELIGIMRVDNSSISNHRTMQLRFPSLDLPMCLLRVDNSSRSSQYMILTETVGAHRCSAVHVFARNLNIYFRNHNHEVISWVAQQVREGRSPVSVIPFPNLCQLPGPTRFRSIRRLRMFN